MGFCLLRSSYVNLCAERKKEKRKGMPCREKKVSLKKQDSSLCVSEVCAIFLFSFSEITLSFFTAFSKTFGWLSLEELVKRLTAGNIFRGCLLPIPLSSKERVQSGTFLRVCTRFPLTYAEEWDFPQIFFVLIVLYDSLGFYVCVCECMCVSACVWALDQRWHCIPTSLIPCSSGFERTRPPMNTSFSHYRCH